MLYKSEIVNVKETKEMVDKCLKLYAQFSINLQYDNSTISAEWISKTFTSYSQQNISRISLLRITLLTFLTSLTKMHVIRTFGLSTLVKKKLLSSQYPFTPTK